MTDLVIREAAPEQVPLELLLLADPNESKVRAYLPGCRCFIAVQNEQVLGACAVTQPVHGVAELMSIAVCARQQRSGVGSRLLRAVIDAVRDSGARALEVGTGSFGYQLAFYQRQGFRVTAIDRDFFVRHYPQPIHEEGIQLRDMLRLTLEFAEQA